MRKTRTRKSTLQWAVTRICVVILILLVIYPIFWMIMSSIKAPLEFTENAMYALPEGFYWQNYVQAWTVGKMNVFYKNSVITTFVSLVFTLAFSATISFAIVKMRWKGSKLSMLLFSFGIVVPVQMVLIPLFSIYNQTGLINTRTCLIITYIGFSMSMAIYLFTGYMRSIPDDIMEAAIIDGCNIYQVFTKVVIPMSKNAAATVLVVSFFTKWNDLIFSMTFVNSQKLKTIQTGLLYFQDEFGNKDWGPIFAAITITILPTILIYIILNKKVIQGMTEGAVKG